MIGITTFLYSANKKNNCPQNKNSLSPNVRPDTVRGVSLQLNLTKIKREKSACSVSLPIGGSKGLGTQNRKRQTDEKIKTQREDKYSLQYFTCLCFTGTRGGAGVSIFFQKSFFFSKTQYSRFEFFIAMKMQFLSKVVIFF